MIINDLSSLYWKPLRAGDVRWNFEKFLVDPEGRAVMRFTAPVEPVEMEPVIEEFIRTWTAKKQREIYSDLLSELNINY
ncbi:PREDICTED: glutathione peroxidase 2-like [Branchiostoma belcheri]|uniref:Glutathione peroxidase 2-like n=1 Tax=Branchiostoma belcheri TaxID=7741 RepID=A0A6P5AJV3_BRABE|nr:PREDICTED: glutathione peroxidase 2-like [Branchiostoma belcheri]